MKKYSVYCTFFDKKVKYNVFAESENNAIQMARNNLTIDKVVCNDQKNNDAEPLRNLGKQMGVDFSDIFK